MSYINNTTGNVISDTDYRNLPSCAKSNYTRRSSSNDSGDFLTSAAIGAATDSALLGGLLGGSMLGGVMGDMMDGDLFD